MFALVRRFISRRTPIFFEYSKVPVWLSKVSPIEIKAISFACFVWSRGKADIKTRSHETIHYHQQLEMLFVFQWFLYGVFWFIGLIKYKDSARAYREIPFEREAYANEAKLFYLDERPLWNWVKYIKD